MGSEVAGRVQPVRAGGTFITWETTANSKIDGNWFSETMRLKATICGGTVLGKPWNLVSLPNALKQILLLSSFREKEDTREVVNLLRFGQ